MQAAKEKLRMHRAKLLKRGVSPAEYARTLGISAQRLSRIMSANAVEPTVSEAFRLQAAAKIAPKAWLEN